VNSEHKAWLMQIFLLYGIGAVGTVTGIVPEPVTTKQDDSSESIIGSE
jgi:hypothetical protein